MDGGETTAEQRLERLRGLLSGTRSDSRVARNVARVPKANVLFGALLHAADRLRQGEELTELEERLLGTLRRMVPEEEIREWGRVYREALSARTTLAGVPEVITARSLSQGYGVEDLAEDLPAVTQEWMAQPNWSVVDHKALAAGEDFDSAEFIEGMREWGFGVTVPAWVTAAAEGRTVQEKHGPALEGAGATAYRFFLEYENFHVHRVVGDGWPGPRDEIRWTSNGQSDLRARAEPFLSQEFGGETAKAGRTPAFGPQRHQRLAFNGAADQALVLNITCWEWDTGDGNDNSIGESLYRLNDDPLFSTLWEAFSAVAPTLLGLLMDITSFAISLVSLIAKNDVSSSRTLLLDRHDLAALSQNGSAQWHFNGDGHHELKVKFTGDTIPYPVSKLEIAARTGTTWASTGSLTLPFDSMNPGAPALTEHNGNLYCAVRGKDRRVYVARHSGGQWSGFGAAPQVLTDYAPALVSFGGYLFLAHTGTWGLQALSHSTNGADWTPPQLLPFFGTSAPALAVRNNALHYATTRDTQIYFTYSHTPADARTWAAPTAVPHAVSYQAPALATADGNLYLAFTNTASQSALAVHNGHQWEYSVLGAATEHAPALAIHDGNKLAYAVRGKDDKVWISHHAGSEAFAPVPSTATTQSPPGLVTYNNTLHLGYGTVV